MSKLPPLPHWCEPGSPFAEQMQAYATAATEPLLQRIAHLEDSLKAWRRNAELADQDNRRLGQENKELKKEIERLIAAHESTVYSYSLASKKG